jgi:gas vesicle protein
VTQAVADGLAAVVAEHRHAVALFGSDTREDTLKRAAEKIRTTKYKLSAYAEYLAAEKERLDRAVADAERELREKVEQIAGEVVHA